MILLKGPAIAQWLYSAGVRPYGDIDLLLPSTELENAGQLLKSRGYERRIDLPVEDRIDVDRPSYAFSWRHREGFLVELHRTLVGIRVPPREAWPILSRNPDRLVVGGASLSVLRLPARAMHLALHAAQHGPDVEKPLEDLRRGLTKEGIEVWREAHQIAIGLDAEEAFTSGLAVTPEGEEMLGQLGLSRAPSLDVELHATHARSSARSLEWFRRLPSGDKAKWVARKIVPTPQFMRLWHPLARRNAAGLVLAYLWRPVWLAKELALGLRDRRRVRLQIERRERKT